MRRQTKCWVVPAMVVPYLKGDKAEQHLEVLGDARPGLGEIRGDRALTGAGPARNLSTIARRVGSAIAGFETGHCSMCRSQRQKNQARKVKCKRDCFR